MLFSPIFFQILKLDPRLSLYSMSLYIEFHNHLIFVSFYFQFQEKVYKTLLQIKINMRPHNSPQTKTSNIYKSSTMLRKVSPQETIVSTNMIQSKKQLTNVRSQELIRSTSQNSAEQNLRNIKGTIVGKNRPVDIKNLDRKLSQNQRKQTGKTQEKAYTFQNDDQYIGEWIYDERQLKQKPHGYGCYKFKKQNIQYRGYFSKGVMHGTGTFHRLINKSKPQLVYEGQWMNGQKNGTGKYYYDQLTFYEGNWNRNRKQGKGKFKSAQGQYNGMWLNDNRHGKGVLKLNNGTVYDGDWQNNEFIGGQIRYSNGDMYKGQVNNKFERNQQGEYVLGTKQQTYKGSWRNNKKEGQCLIFYNVNGQKFTGEARNDIREGANCTYEWKNGCKAICSFENNVPSKGTFTTSNNQTFQFQIKPNK